MVHLMELPLEVLGTIVIFLAISSDCAEHLARASAICKEFRNLATREGILKIVNFKNIWLLGREPHHVIDGLLSRESVSSGKIGEGMPIVTVYPGVIYGPGKVIVGNVVAQLELHGRRIRFNFAQEMPHPSFGGGSGYGGGAYGPSGCAYGTGGGGYGGTNRLHEVKKA